MLLARKLQVEVTEEQCYYFSHMSYAASKLWNLCNYEKYNWKELGLEEFPNWYYQKKKWKKISGTSYYHHKPHKKFVKFWINLGSPIIL